MVRKVDPYLFMPKTMICLVYVADCTFWSRSQYDIDKTMKYLKEDGTSKNWEHSNGESVSEFLGIDTKILDDGEFYFYKTELILKVLEDTGVENFNGFPTPANFEEPLGTYDNGSEAKIDCNKYYNSVIGMMLNF